MNGLAFLALTAAVFAVIATVGFLASRRQRTEPTATAHRKLHALDTKRRADQERHRAQTGGGL